MMSSWSSCDASVSSTLRIRGPLDREITRSDQHKCVYVPTTPLTSRRFDRRSVARQDCLKRETDGNQDRWMLSTRDAARQLTAAIQLVIHLPQLLLSINIKRKR